MSKTRLLIKRYSEAFAFYVNAGIGIEKAADGLKRFKLLLHSNMDFEEFLYNPEINFQEKCAVIDNVLKKYFTVELGHLLKLLLEKGRIEIITGICDYFRVKYSHGEAVDALLRTSYPVDTKILKLVKKKLEEKLNKKMNLYLELDPDLLGGLQIRIGNTIIDGSVRRRLDNLREKLMTAQV